MKRNRAGRVTDPDPTILSYLDQDKDLICFTSVTRFSSKEEKDRIRIFSGLNFAPHTKQWLTNGYLSETLTLLQTHVTESVFYGSRKERVRSAPLAGRHLRPLPFDYI